MMYLGGPPVLKVSFSFVPPCPRAQPPAPDSDSFIIWHISLVSLECGTPGATDNLAVTWLSKGLPRELELRETLGPVPNSSNLSLSLPLGQLNGHLTCMVSNPVDEKNATLYLENICPLTGGCDLLGRVTKVG